MKTLTSQQVFNASATHLLNQGKQALRDKEARYRIGEKTGCAMFPFMKVGYNKGWKVEGNNLLHEDVQAVLRKNGVDTDEDLSLCLELQNVHDHYNPMEWPSLLSSISKKYDLVMVKTKLKDASVKVRK